jgi:hypothetical protein
LLSARKQENPRLNKETEVNIRGTTLLASSFGSNKLRAPYGAVSLNQMPLKHGNGVTGSTYGGKPLSGNQLMGALPSHRCTGFHHPGSLLASICQVLSRSSFVALLSLLYATCEKMQAKSAVCKLQPCTQGEPAGAVL